MAMSEFYCENEILPFCFLFRRKASMQYFVQWEFDGKVHDEKRWMDVLTENVFHKFQLNFGMISFRFNEFINMYIVADGIE